MVLAADVFDVHSGLGVLHVQRLEMLDNNARDGKVAEPLVVRWNDEPRRVCGAAAREGFFVGRDIIVPESAFLVVGLADFPLPGRVVEALLESL